MWPCRYNILHCVSSLHQPIVHRDLAARNVLLDSREFPTVCKVADFGLARAVSEDTDTGKAIYTVELGVGTNSYSLHKLPNATAIDHMMNNSHISVGKLINSFTPMRHGYLPLAPVSCSQVNKHLPLTCRWFTWHVDLDDVWPCLEPLPATHSPESTTENLSCKFCSSFPCISRILFATIV